MSLTRHLYCQDEVISALQFSLLSRNGRALFWLWELVVSMENLAARECAVEAWLLWGGGHDPFLLSLPFPTTAETTYTLMTRVQRAIQKAGNLNAHKLLLDVLSLAEPPPLQQVPPDSIWIPEAPDTGSEEDVEQVRHFWRVFYIGIKTQSRRFLLWHLRQALDALCPNTIWMFLQEIVGEMAPPSMAVVALAVNTLSRHATPRFHTQLLHLVNAILILCDTTTATTPVPKSQTQITVLSLRQWMDWMSRVGRRSARVHAIPYSVLHSGTTRGSLSSAYTTREDLLNPIPCIGGGHACTWWREAVIEAGAVYDADADTLQFPNDAVLEHFYAVHFPDDIPDEWSLEDQAKSHGVGCAETASLAPLQEILVEWSAEKVDDAPLTAGLQAVTIAVQ